MLGRLNSHELRPLVDPGVFFAEKIDLSSRRNNAICYDLILINFLKFQPILIIFSDLAGSGIREGFGKLSEHPSEMSGRFALPPSGGAGLGFIGRRPTKNLRKKGVACRSAKKIHFEQNLDKRSQECGIDIKNKIVLKIYFCHNINKIFTSSSKA